MIAPPVAISGIAVRQRVKSGKTFVRKTRSTSSSVISSNESCTVCIAALLTRPRREKTTGGRANSRTSRR